MTEQKLICYELNEVPWPVVDKYVKLYPGGAFDRLLAQSACYTSHTIDEGELHPWTTWPTLHRGVSNQQHRITSLNQDLTQASQWPPVWQLLSEAGVDVGVCGSLQSYPPMDNANVRFHIPDTFAAGPETRPSQYSAFQMVNLMQTRANSATTSSVGLKEIGTAVDVLRSGVRMSTGLKLAQQLVRERINSNYRKRRSLLQPELAIDIFRDAMKRYQPSFATFFTNHVAGMMHRYWKYSFPEDFGYTLKANGSDGFNAQSIMQAMKQAEAHLNQLLELCARFQYDLLICSSMGQAAIDRGDYVPELKVTDFDRLLAGLNIKYPVRHNMAMHPDIALEFEKREDLEHLRAKFQSLVDSSGGHLFYTAYEPVGLTLNMRISHSAAIAIDGIVRNETSRFTASELGLDSFERDIGTGYHVPEGIVIWHRRDLKENSGYTPREMIDSRQILPSILEYFEVSRPDYLMPAIGESLKPLKTPRPEEMEPVTH